MRSVFIQGIFLSGIILLHLPFIQADPDHAISWSRGPFSDEGLYSEQIRNYINHGHFKFEESDVLVKSPLLSAIFFIPFLLLGTHLWVARLVVILLSAITLLYCHKKFRVPQLMPVFFLCTMLQYYIFHHTHFALAEMISSSFVLLSICFYNSFIHEDAGKKRRNLFLSISFLSLAWYVKIQFIYVALFIPAAYAAYILFNIKKSGKQELVFLGLMLLTSLLYASVYYFGWILPNKAFINYILPQQAGQFKISADTPLVIRFNLQTIFLGKEVLLFTITFVFSLVTGIFILFRSEEKWFAALFICSIIWVGLESHKLAMTYLPSRYLISTYCSMGLLISAVMVYMLNTFNGIRMAIPFTIIALLSSYHFIDYFKAIENRQYVLRDINKYLAQFNFGEKPVIGPWAASCNWESKAITLTVLNNGLNHKDPINRLKPAMVISEADEMESANAYKSQDIDLAAISDSVKTYRLAAWQINFYWIRK